MDLRSLSRQGIYAGTLWKNITKKKKNLPYKLRNEPERMRSTFRGLVRIFKAVV